VIALTLLRIFVSPIVRHSFEEEKCETYSAKLKERKKNQRFAQHNSLHFVLRENVSCS